MSERITAAMVADAFDVPYDPDDSITPLEDTVATDAVRVAFSTPAINIARIEYERNYHDFYWIRAYDVFGAMHSRSGIPPHLAKELLRYASMVGIPCVDTLTVTT